MRVAYPALPASRSLRRPCAMPQRIVHHFLRDPVPESEPIVVRTVAPPPAPVPAVIPASAEPMNRERRALPAAAAEPATNALRFRGDYWEVRYAGSSGLVEDCRGLRYIALLIRDGRAERGPIHARELVARADGQPAGAIELEGKDEVIDGVAKAQFVARIEEIAAERVRASALDDFDRLAALDDEADRITEQLTRAAGRRGRAAGFDNGAEKARKAVGKAITEAIARLAAHAALAAVAAHLTTAIRKGQWLSYNDSAAWDVEFQLPLPRK